MEQRSDTSSDENEIIEDVTDEEWKNRNVAADDEVIQLTYPLYLESWLEWNKKKHYPVHDVEAVAKKMWQIYDEIGDLDDFPTKETKYNEVMEKYIKVFFSTEAGAKKFRKEFGLKGKQMEALLKKIIPLDNEIARLSNILERPDDLSESEEWVPYVATGKRIKVGKRYEEEFRNLTSEEVAEYKSKLTMLQDKLFELEKEQADQLMFSLYDMLDEIGELLLREAKDRQKQKAKKGPKKQKKSSSSSGYDDKESSVSAESSGSLSGSDDPCSGCVCPSDLLAFLLRLKDANNEAYSYVKDVIATDEELLQLFTEAQEDQEDQEDEKEVNIAAELNDDDGPVDEPEESEEELLEEEEEEVKPKKAPKAVDNNAPAAEAKAKKATKWLNLSPENKEILATSTVADLQDLCRRKGIRGFAGKKKDELINLCATYYKYGGSRERHSRRRRSRSTSRHSRRHRSRSTSRHSRRHRSRSTSGHSRRRSRSTSRHSRRGRR